MSNDFATALRKKILDGARTFDITEKNDKGRETGYSFFRICRGKFDLLGFAVNYRKDELVSSYGSYGIIVGNTFYTFAQNDFLAPVDSMYLREQLDEENRSFFGKRIGDVFEELVNKVNEAIAAHADGLTEGNIPLAADYKASIAENIDIENNIARGEAPERVLPKAEEILKAPAFDAVEYIFRQSDYVLECVDKFFANEELRDRFYYGCYCYLVESRVYEERTANLTPSEVSVRALNKAFAEARESGAKNVRVIVEGKDELLDPYVVKRYADGAFSIEGVEVVGKVDAEREILGDGLSPYALDFVSPVLKDYSGRKATYLDKIPVLSILRVEYGRKVLYARAA